VYPVSTEYQTKIKENNRVFRMQIEIQHSQGQLMLGDKDLVDGSFTYTESSQAGEDFTVGSVVASHIEFKVLNKAEYADIDWEGATVIPTVGLLLSSEHDSEQYFLSPTHPAEFPEGAETELWEYVPLGRFNIDDAVRLRNTIDIKAIDNMIELDKPYSLSQLSYPATLYQIYVNICNVADIAVGTASFPNSDYLVAARPDDSLTLRDVLSYVAALAGRFARCSRTGALELAWYEPSGLTLGPGNRFEFRPKDYAVQIKGVMATVDDVTYLSGTDDYAIDLTGNPLLQGDYEAVLSAIYTAVKDVVFTPYDSRWQGDPAIQAGDMITQVDRDGNEYETLVTRSTYKYRGASILSANGLPLKAKGYKGSTNKKLVEIKRRIDKEVGDKLTTLEQAQLNATELIANMLGGHAIPAADAFYIADNPDLELATKVWKWGIGGFGYSENGVNGPYDTAITAEGSIVASLVSAGIVTADMVQAGLLQSQDGSSWLNLDDGSFNFKGALVWDSELSKLILGADVQISWESITDGPNLTKIDANGLYTGTISADNIQGGTISGVTIDVTTDAAVGDSIRLGSPTSNITLQHYPGYGFYLNRNSTPLLKFYSNALWIGGNLTLENGSSIGVHQGMGSTTRSSIIYLSQSLARFWTSHSGATTEFYGHLHHRGLRLAFFDAPLASQQSVNYPSNITTTQTAGPSYTYKEQEMLSTLKTDVTNLRSTLYNLVAALKKYGLV
jgi:hypothetical protein